ncbi:hypothetical protein B0H14DRAFT_2614301 [Mycena olivaceomarginata]|nr:hypothetical protein B0H14DRAFT_2614301 [Mycena olivaceomarginata]
MAFFFDLAKIPKLGCDGFIGIVRPLSNTDFGRLAKQHVPSHCLQSAGDLSPWNELGLGLLATQPAYSSAVFFLCIISLQMASTAFNALSIQTAYPLRSNFASYSLCNLWARWATVWPTCGTLALSSAVSIAHTTSQTGKFEPPFYAAVESYVTEYDNRTDPTKVALRRMEERALQAEKRLSTEDVAAARPPPKPKGPKCPVCFKHCQVSVNPWQSTNRDLMVAEFSDDSDSDEKAEKRELDHRDSGQRRSQNASGAPQTCNSRATACELQTLLLRGCSDLMHSGFQACLAHHIYRCLNLVFDTARYGTVVKTPAAATPGRRVEFPISCPACQVKPGEQPVEISDMTARLVLGEANMDEWNHARFLSMLNLIYCPHKGCDETFDADDVAPSPDGVTLVRCPRCRGSLCKVCKSVWHENLTCAQYQTLPITERAPEDVVFATLAAQEKWRRCPKCSAMVELKFGCKRGMQLNKYVSLCEPSQYKTGTSVISEAGKRSGSEPMRDIEAPKSVTINYRGPESNGNLARGHAPNRKCIKRAALAATLSWDHFDVAIAHHLCNDTHRVDTGDILEVPVLETEGKRDRFRRRCLQNLLWYIHCHDFFSS